MVLGENYVLGYCKLAPDTCVCQTQTLADCTHVCVRRKLCLCNVSPLLVPFSRIQEHSKKWIFFSSGVGVGVWLGGYLVSHLLQV